MPIKVGFSSLVCPQWDLAKIVAQAAAIGYDGVELRGLGGKPHLPDAAELADDPAGVSRLFTDAGVQLLSLTSPATFESANRQAQALSGRELTETMELAGKLGCPYVRILLGQTQGTESRGTLGRVAGQLRPLAETAAGCGVTILVENAGDFLGSYDLWYVLDAVSHPALRGSLNPLHARLCRERPTISVPRLARMLAAFRIADGNFNSEGYFLNHEIPGQGSCELVTAIDLLKGVCFGGWMVVEWPQARAGLVDPGEGLPGALSFVRERLAHADSRLTAYAKDKYPPNFNPPPSVEATPAS